MKSNLAKSIALKFKGRKAKEVPGLKVKMPQIKAGAKC